MKTKPLSIILCFFLNGCSNSSQTVLTEFNNSNDEPKTISKEDITSQQNKDFFSSFSSREASQTEILNLQKDKDSYDKSSERNQETGFVKNLISITFDPQKATDLINRYRKEKKLNPLKLNADLTLAAITHSKDLSKWDRISHYGSDGSNTLDRVKKTGYNARIAAENIGSGATNFEDIFDGWAKSPGQNKNLLLSDATDIGLGLVQDPKTEFKSFWTLVVAAPL